MRREPRRSGSTAGDRALPAAFVSAPAPELPVFHGGLVGYFGYDTVRFTESKLMDSCPPDEPGVPYILLVLAEEVLIFDGLRGTLTVVVNAGATRDNAYEAALARLDEIEATLASVHAQFGSITLDPALGDFDDSAIRYRTQQSEYEDWVERIRGVHPRRRGDAGRAFAAVVVTVESGAAVPLPGAQELEPLALHVLSGFGWV